MNLAFGCACVVRGRGALTLLIQDLPSSLYLNESIRSLYTHTHTNKEEEERHIISKKNIGAAREHKKNLTQRFAETMIGRLKNVSSSLSRCWSCRTAMRSLSSSRKVKIVEVGPRDGLQNEPVLIDTDVRVSGRIFFRFQFITKTNTTGKDRIDRQIS